MKLAESMKNITEDIVTTHHVRVRALGNLISEVNDSLDKFASDRKAMSKAQAAELARFAGDLTGHVATMIKGFASDRKAMSKEQAAGLARFAGDLAGKVQKELEQMSKDRALSANELKGRLQKGAKDLRNLIKKTLADYHKAHVDMSEALRHNLQGFVKDIIKSVDNLHLGKIVADLRNETRGVLGDYRADIHKARGIWSDMTRTIAKTRAQPDEAPIVEGGETVGTVEGAVRKIHRRRRKKSKK